MAEIKIDSKAFQERLSHFVTAWKADKRSGDALFAGASSIVILMGKVDEEPEFYKNNAMHVCLCRGCDGCSGRAALTVLQFWLLGYEFPTTLMLFTLDTLYILTTQKKGLLQLDCVPAVRSELTPPPSEIPRPD
jgi:nucleosome binding factor SPN SPT16 subunit